MYVIQGVPVVLVHAFHLCTYCMGGNRIYCMEGYCMHGTSVPLA